MAKVTPGFKLYLYQLLSRELGTGRQTLLPQLEAVLAADDIIPQDLECSSTQELVDACDDFLKVRVFKKGRVYVTVVRNEEWEQMLATPEPKPAEKRVKPAGGPKTWKNKKSGKKTFKPVKPGKQRREREAALAAERERLAAEAAAEKQRLEAEIAAEKAQQQELQPDVQPLPEGQQAPVGTLPEPQDEAALAAKATQDETASENAVNKQAQNHSENLPPRPAARTVAEIMEEARAQEAAQALAERPSETLAVQRHEDSFELPATPILEATPNPETELTPEAESIPATKAESVLTPEMEPMPAPDLKPASKPAPESKPKSKPTPETKPKPKPVPAPQPSPISLNITYNPYEDMERELERQRQEEASAQAQIQHERPQSIAAPLPASQAPAPATPSLAGMPLSITEEVSCKDALLRVLYQLLPFDVEPMAVLDEDWRVARSTGSLAGTRNRVSFPLRYQHEDGTPLTVTLRKTARNASGRPWSLALVDGNDGTGASHESVGFEGLPTADEGAWSDLCVTRSDMAINPVREMAQHILIGTWDGFLGALATMAAPERWNYPGEGVGQQSRYGILREYIACTFHRARCQELIAQSADTRFAAFNTGLLTTFGDDIYACLTANKGDIPWKFAGFATAGSGELGARLIASISPLPEPPSYLSSLESVMPDSRRMVILDLEGILTNQLGRLPRAFLHERLEDNPEAQAILQKGATLTTSDLTQLARAVKADSGAYRRMRRALDDAIEQAMRTTKASYRLAAPVYDPAENRTKLLLPLCLVEDGKADCALVLDLQPSGAYRAAVLLSLPRAYACARVISREQPSWLAPKRVL